MPFPDFFVVGASKAGTSSMYHYLDVHPEIYIPAKEPNFFAVNGVKLPLNGPGDREWYEGAYVEEDDYRSLFEGAQQYKISGEASPTYLHSKHAPKKIYEHVPDARLIAILRDPAERAFSHYRHFTEKGLETESFEQAVEQEEERLDAGWFWPRYVEAGRYEEQILRYLEYFSEDQLRIYLFREFTGNTREVMRDVYQFLGVNPEKGPSEYVKRGVSGVPKFSALEYVLSGRNPISQVAKKYAPESLKNAAIKLRNMNKSKAGSDMSEEVRERIVEELRPNINKLEDLIERDLSEWKQ